MSLTADERRVVNQQVARLFQQTPAFHALPPDQRHQILANTASIVDTMVDNRMSEARGRDPYATAQVETGLPPAPELPGTGGGGSGGVDPSQFTGGATDRPDSQFGPRQIGDFGTGIATGVAQAGELLRQVNFPAFVGELIQGVFQAIVDASVQQMKAYGELVQSVTMSLNEFRDANVTPNQGRDHLVGRYPGLMQIKIDSGQPRVGLREDADIDDLPDFQSDLGLDQPLNDLDDEIIEDQLVPAARNDLARSRQQLLATMVMMGINRIVVTDGKINAKLKFNFRASDRMAKSAQDYDYESYGMTTTEQRGPSEYEYEGADVEYDDSGKRKSRTGGSRRWTKGEYQYAQTPAVYVTGVEQTQTEAELSASAQLAGSVSVNFKTESLDLNEFASQADIFRMQQVRGAGRGAPAPPPEGGTPAGTGETGTAAPTP